MSDNSEFDGVVEPKIPPIVIFEEVTPKELTQDINKGTLKASVTVRVLASHGRELD